MDAYKRQGIMGILFVASRQILGVPSSLSLLSMLLASGQCGPQHRYQVHIKSGRDDADR